MENKERNKTNIIYKMFKGAVFVRILNSLTAYLAGIVDGVIISKFLGSDAMAAYGIATPVLFLIPALGGTLATGAQIICANKVGKGQVEETNKYYSTSVVGGLVLSIIFGLILLFFSTQLASMLGASGAASYLLDEASGYLKGFGYGAPAYVLMVLLIPFLQIDGEKKRISIAALTMTLLDIVLDLLNAYVFKQGLFGMAFASSISIWGSAIVMLTYLFKKNKLFKLNIKEFDIKIFGTLLKSGGVFTVRQLCIIVRAFGLNKIIIALLPIEVLSVYTIVSTLRSLFMSVGIGCGDATSVVAGILYGEEDKNGLWRLLKASYKTSTIIAIVSTILIIISAPLCVGIFLNLGSEYDMAIVGLRLCVISLLPFTLHYLYRGYLQSVNKTSEVYVLIVINELVLAIASAFVMAKVLGTNGFFLSFTLQEVLTILVTLLIIRIYTHSSKFDKQTLLQVDSSFGISDDSYIEKTIKTIKDAVDFSKEVYDFCLEKSNNKKLAYALSLCVEEIGCNIAEYGIKNNQEICEALVYEKQGKWAIRFRDNAKAFNPVECLNSLDDNHLEYHLGLRMVFSMCEDASYLNTMNMNNILIKVG